MLAEENNCLEDILCNGIYSLSKLQTYPNLRPSPRVGPPQGCLPRGGADLGRLVPIQCSQKACLLRSFWASRAGRCEFGQVWSSLITCQQILLLLLLQQIYKYVYLNSFVDGGMFPPKPQKYPTLSLKVPYGRRWGKGGLHKMFPVVVGSYPLARSCPTSFATAFFMALCSIRRHSCDPRGGNFLATRANEQTTYTCAYTHARTPARTAQSQGHKRNSFF